MALPAHALKAPGVALAAVGTLTLAPALVAPAAVPPPSVQMHVENIRLAGIGQDIYYAITPWVQYAVGGVSYLINFVPLVGGLTAAQININYFQGIQPVVEATVNYLAGVVQDPLNFFPTTAAYGSALFDIGYNWVSAQLMFIGLPPLQPLPQGSAAVRPDRVTRTPAPAQAVDAASTEPSVAAARDSLRGGHSSASRSRAASTPRPAEATTVRHRATAESRDTDAAPRSAKATARR